VAILVLAASTVYRDFPRRAALLAHDRFIARQFTNLGDRPRPQSLQSSRADV
jgi:hypothetical protein